MTITYDQLEILRRALERLKADAEQDYNADYEYIFEKYVDQANHILAELETTKRVYVEEASEL